MFNLFGRYKILGQLWRTGRLAWRLARDARVPLTAKLVLGATLLYIISPIDVIPDWFPIVGQADDLMALLAGLNLFLRACPRWVVEEHEDAIDGRRDASRGADSFGPRDRADHAPIDARYERVG
jgi:uncharacterized membrane protein YkvA (DUF1232 family)